MVMVLFLGLQSRSRVDVAHGFGFLQHVGSSRIRNSIHVACIGRWIAKHWTPKEVPLASFVFVFFLQLSQHSFILSGVIRSCPPLFPSSSIGHLVTWSGGLIFQCYIFLLFYTVQAKLTAKILEWLATPSPGGSHSVTALRYDTSFLGGPTRNGSQLY